MHGRADSFVFKGRKIRPAFADGYFRIYRLTACRREAQLGDGKLPNETFLSVEIEGAVGVYVFLSHTDRQPYYSVEIFAVVTLRFLGGRKDL